MRRSQWLRTATPEKFNILGTTFPRPKRNGLGRENKMRSKPSDNVAWYDKGPVEWLPRPVRLTYSQLDELRDWMMRETLGTNANSGSGSGLQARGGGGAASSATYARSGAGGANVNYEEFFKIRELHREWSQHPLMPVLGDVEPKFPLNLFKQNHRAKRRFLVRWHKANSPGNWMWMPRGPTVVTPLHRTNPSQYPENWRQMVNTISASSAAALPSSAAESSGSSASSSGSASAATSNSGSAT